MSKKNYPEQRSPQHAQAGGASAQPSGNEVYSSSGGGVPEGRQTPAFHGPQHRGPEAGASRSASPSGATGSLWAMVLGVFALSSLAGYLLWRD